MGPIAQQCESFKKDWIQLLKQVFNDTLLGKENKTTRGSIQWVTLFNFCCKLCRHASSARRASKNKITPMWFVTVQLALDVSVVIGLIK